MNRPAALSFIIRVTARPKSSMSNGRKSAVAPSRDVACANAQTLSQVRPSPRYKPADRDQGVAVGIARVMARPASKRGLFSKLRANPTIAPVRDS